MVIARACPSLPRHSHVASHLGSVSNPKCESETTNRAPQILIHRLLATEAELLRPAKCGQILHLNAGLPTISPPDWSPEHESNPIRNHAAYSTAWALSNTMVVPLEPAVQFATAEGHPTVPGPATPAGPHAATFGYE